MNTIVIDFEGDFTITLRPATRGEFAHSIDFVAFGGAASDMAANLWAACAVQPSAEELTAFREDYAMASDDVVGALNQRAGMPSTPGARYPVVRVEDQADLQAQLAKLTEESREGEDAALPALESRIAALKARLLPPELLEAAKRTRRPLVLVTPAGPWLFKPPGAQATADYDDGQRAFIHRVEGSSFYECARALTLACVLYPSPQVAETLIEDMPAIPWAVEDSLKAHGGRGKGKVRSG